MTNSKGDFLESVTTQESVTVEVSFSDELEIDRKDVLSEPRETVRLALVPKDPAVPIQSVLLDRDQVVRLAAALQRARNIWFAKD